MGREPLPNVFMIDAACYDVRKRQTLSKWTIVDARRNVYSHAELRKLLIAAGFRVETAWGVLAGGPFDNGESWHQTIVARKLNSSL